MGRSNPLLKSSNLAKGYLFLRVEWIFLLFVFATGCGYRLSNDFPVDNRFTLSVPYFTGDKDGLLTSAIIAACARSDRFDYISKNGVFILEGEIVGVKIEEIGYQYDRDPVSRKRENRLVPVEERPILCVSFSLRHSASGKCLYGPFTVQSAADFDFINPDNPIDILLPSFIEGSNRTLFFSLGQLDSRSGAKKAALSSVYDQLAEKIVLGLEHLDLDFYP